MKHRMNSKKDRRGIALKSKKRVKRVLRVAFVGKWSGSDWSRQRQGYTHEGKELCIPDMFLSILKESSAVSSQSWSFKRVSTASGGAYG